MAFRAADSVIASNRSRGDGRGSEKSDDWFMCIREMLAHVAGKGASTKTRAFFDGICELMDAVSHSGGKPEPAETLSIVIFSDAFRPDQRRGVHPLPSSSHSGPTSNCHLVSWTHPLRTLIMRGELGWGGVRLPPFYPLGCFALRFSLQVFALGFLLGCDVPAQIW